MRKPIKIGSKEYKYKKDAIAYYKVILNSYNFGESLNETHFNDLLDLLYYNYLNDLCEDSEVYKKEIDNTEELNVLNIKVSKVQFNTKCFEVFYSDNTSQYISYLMIINDKQYNPESLFYVACRNSVHNDIRSVKQAYFDNYSVKGQVKCQETGILSYWSELVVDHRQPHTFSIIVDRYKEVTKLNLDEIEYTSNEQNHIIFKNENLTFDFKKYHKEKSHLRIVRKECNLSRTNMGRIKKTIKDLTIKNTTP